MNIADMVIHIHQVLLPVHQEKLEEEVRVLEGVTAAGLIIELSTGLVLLMFLSR